MGIVTFSGMAVKYLQGDGVVDGIVLFKCIQMALKEKKKAPQQVSALNWSDSWTR